MVMVAVIVVVVVGVVVVIVVVVVVVVVVVFVADVVMIDVVVAISEGTGLHKPKVHRTIALCVISQGSLNRHLLLVILIPP